MKHATVRFEQQRRYEMSVAEAWRILADTDHLNRAIGLPAVEFSPPSGSLLRRASARAFGVVRLRWAEFPFDWVREHRYVVRREFENGPLVSLEGGVELLPVGDDVIVRSFAEFTPRNLTGRLLWRLGRVPVTDLLDYCDRYLARKETGKADPVPVPRARPTVDLARLDGLLDELARCPIQGELIAVFAEAERARGRTRRRQSTAHRHRDTKDEERLVDRRNVEVGGQFPSRRVGFRGQRRAGGDRLGDARLGLGDFAAQVPIEELDDQVTDLRGQASRGGQCRTRFVLSARARRRFAGHSFFDPFDRSRPPQRVGE